MASKRTTNRNRKRVKSEYPSDVHKEVIKKSSPVKMVRLRLRINARYVANGDNTGTKYTFNGAGSVTEVHPLDAPGFLARNTQKSCCSGNKPSPLFELVGE